MKRKKLTKMLCVAMFFALLTPLASMASEKKEPKSIFEKATISLTSKGGHKKITLKVDLARSEAAREKGMMFMRVAPKGYGMLFDLGEPQEVSMWMKNCYFPLDMFFIDNTGRIFYVKRSAVPMSLDYITAPKPARYVLEMPVADSKKLGLDTDWTLKLFQAAP